jgi:hypothetical protein
VDFGTPDPFANELGDGKLYVEYIPRGSSERHVLIMGFSDEAMWVEHSQPLTDPSPGAIQE